MALVTGTLNRNALTNLRGFGIGISFILQGLGYLE